jgi:hypothetical protein
MLFVAMIVLSAPLLANAAPGLVDNESAGQSANVYPMSDDVDCSKLDDENARQKCREAKRKNDDDKANVNCSKLENDAARRRCREAKIKN